MAGFITSKGLKMTRPLWPQPSFNLHQRLVRLACAKVSWRQAKGYIVKKKKSQVALRKMLKRKALT